MFTIVALSLCYQPHLRPIITTPRASTPMLSEQWSVDAIGKAIGNMAFEKTTDAMAFVVEKIDTALSEEPIIDATKSEPIRRPKAAQITRINSGTTIMAKKNSATMSAPVYFDPWPSRV